MSELGIMHDIEPLLETVGQFLREDIDLHVFSGATVAVITPSGTSYVEAGTTDYTGTKPFDRNALVDIASVTKALTATAYVRLSQLPGHEGLLHMPVSDFIPGLLTIDEPSKRITVADFLTMNVEWKLSGSTAALTREIMAEPISDAQKRQKIIDTITQTQLLKLKPGMHNYQDATYIMLGIILEKYFAQQGRFLTYEDILREQVFSPLGMDSATLHPDPEKCVAMGMRDEHVIKGVPHDPKAIFTPGHAGVFVSTKDLARFVRMVTYHGVAQDHETFLNPHSYSLLTTPTTLDPNRGWWGMGLRVLRHDDPHYVHWYGDNAHDGSLCSNGYTGAHFTIFEGRQQAVVFTSNYHLPYPGAEKTGDKPFPALQVSRKRILDELTRE